MCHQKSRTEISPFLIFLWQHVLSARERVEGRKVQSVGSDFGAVQMLLLFLWLYLERYRPSEFQIEERGIHYLPFL